MKGCVLYDIFYPKPIYLNRGETTFILDGQFFFVGVSSHQCAVSTMSFPNSIYKSESKYEFANQINAFENQTCLWDPKPNGQAEIGFLMTTSGQATNFNINDQLTTIRIAFESDSIENTIDSAVKALNHLIQVYRYASKDVEVKETDFVTGLHPYLVCSHKTYTQQEAKKETVRERIEGIFDDGWKPEPLLFHSLQKRLDKTFDSNKITGEVAHYLASDSFYPWMQVMNRSYELSLIQKHHNSAIIEAFLSVELRLFEHTVEKKIRIKFNRRKQDSPTIFNVINTLKKSIGNDLYSCLHTFRKLRNDIVHNGYQSTHDECIESLNTATKVHQFVDKEDL